MAAPPSPVPLHFQLLPSEVSPSSSFPALAFPASPWLQLLFLPSLRPVALLGLLPTPVTSPLVFPGPQSWSPYLVSLPTCYPPFPHSLRGRRHLECQCSISATPSWAVASWGWPMPWPTPGSSSSCESWAACGGRGRGAVWGKLEAWGPSLSCEICHRALLLCIALLSSYSIHLLLTCAGVVGKAWSLTHGLDPRLWTYPSDLRP